MIFFGWTITYSVTLCSECEEGRWGLGCAKLCPSCENGGVCDRQNGTCICLPGYMGDLCQNGKNFNF